MGWQGGQDGERLAGCSTCWGGWGGQGAGAGRLFADGSRDGLGENGTPAACLLCCLDTKAQAKERQGHRTHRGWLTQHTHRRAHTQAHTCVHAHARARARTRSHRPNPPHPTHCHQGLCFHHPRLGPSASLHTHTRAHTHTHTHTHAPAQRGGGQGLALSEQGARWGWGRLM